jgi:hypothetical protein
MVPRAVARPMSAPFPRILPTAVTVAFLTAMLAGALAPGASAVAPGPVPNASGLWKDGTDVMFRISQPAGDTSITSTIVNDTCTAGPRDYMITATTDGVSLNGTMQRCAPADDALSVNCNLSHLWQTPITANFTAGEMTGEYRGEHWVWDTGPNGTWVNCTLDYYYQETFTFTRLDCGVRSFEDLAAQYVSDPSKVPEALDLAKRAEGGEHLLWTANQMAPGGFKSKVDHFVAEMVKWGYHGTVNSAYRPLLYQAHFADLRICALQMVHTLIDQPDLGPALADSVAAVNAEVDHHGIKNEIFDVGGLHIKVVFVCYRDPLASCPHTDERAADISIAPDDGALDWVGAMYGFCRPYLKSSVPDRPHWEYIGDSPFGNPKCNSLGPGPGQANIQISGNSPVNLLLTDSAGYQIGYDPQTSRAVNDFGSQAYYSGPGTHPQIIELAAVDTTAGDYSITGVGTGDGDYTVAFNVVNFDGTILDSANVTGHAASGSAISKLNLTMKADYSPDPLFTVAHVSSRGGFTNFAVTVDNTSQTVQSTGGGLSAMMFSKQGSVVALKADGTAGTTHLTIPKGLETGPFKVRVDGTEVPFTKSEDAEGATLVFDRPAGAQFVTVEGASGTGTAAPAPAAGDLAIVIALVAAVGVAVVVGALYLNRKRGKPPAT